MRYDSTSLTRRSVLRGSAAAAATAGLVGPVAATPGRSPGPKENEMLVGVSAGTDLVGTVQEAVPAEASVVSRNETLRYVAVRFPEGSSAAERVRFVERVRKRPGVKYAEPNATLRAFFVPNDPEYANQYAPGMVGAPTAWDTTLGSSSVTVAVVDQGIEYDHPDLDGNVCSPNGYDFVTGDPDPYPVDLSTEYHGTAVAGLIAAETDNNLGIAGLSQSCLMSVRALDQNGSGSIADIADGVQWATDHGADVINLSLGGGGYSSTLKNAVSYAQNMGSLPIAAAGGSATSPVAYPARYSECLAVSAVDPNGNLASFSSYGPAVELAAPGVDVYTTTTRTRGSTTQLSGTSFATAVVSGCAALAASQWPGLTNTELRNHLKGTATPLGITTTRQGCGRVDAGDAVDTDPTNRANNCAATGGGGGSCGARTTGGTISDSLSGPGDYDCWTWNWTYANPCEVVLDLYGPSTADFDLYVNEGTTTCPSPWSHDYGSYSMDSQETITVSNPGTSTPLQIDVESYIGAGSYILDVTEKAT